MRYRALQGGLFRRMTLNKGSVSCCMLWYLEERQMWQLPRGAEEREALPPTFCDMKRQETVDCRGRGRARGLDSVRRSCLAHGQEQLMTVADWNVRAAYAYIYRVVNNRDATLTISLNKGREGVKKEDRDGKIPGGTVSYFMIIYLERAQRWSSIWMQ